MSGLAIATLALLAPAALLITVVVLVNLWDFIRDDPVDFAMIGGLWLVMISAIAGVVCGIIWLYLAVNGGG